HDRDECIDRGANGWRWLLPMAVAVDPEVQAVLEQLAAAGFPGFASMDPAGARAYFEQFAASVPPGPELPKVEDRAVAGPAGEVPIRVYTPAGDPPVPLLGYFPCVGCLVCDLHTSYAI